MMDGVEVLSQTLVEGHSQFVDATIALCILFVLALLFAIVVACEESSVSPVIATVVLFAIVIIPFAILGFGFEVGAEPDKMHYKVTISDDVSLVEFNEKYEIIEQEGKIYEVVEREVSDDTK